MNFYILRLPEEQVVISGASENLEVLESECKKEGLFYSEFEENPTLYFIPCDICGFHAAEMGVWIKENDLRASSKLGLPSGSTTKENHIRHILRLQEEMAGWESDGIGKTKIIAARIQKIPTSRGPLELFNVLCREYPSACVFLYSSSLHGTWIGATPEIIMRNHEGVLYTMSLAGTRWETGQDTDWDEKNIEEQRIVTDFILSTIREENMYAETVGPYTLKAGPVEHLATNIKINASPADGVRLIRRLVPTPALSGFPRNKAIHIINSLENKDLFINKHESSSRQCYGGVVGYIAAEGDYYSYANLRSGRYDSESKEMILYAGGGITLRSDPLQEWEETERKLSTIRRFL